MNIDLTALAGLISTIDPAAAGIVAAVLFVVQHVAAKQGANLTLGGLISWVTGLFGGAKGTPALVPSVPTTPATPAASPSIDPLANRPVLKTLRDVLGGLFAQKVTSSLAAAPDDHEAALALFSKVSSALK